MDAEPIGKPGCPELAFCTMSTARKRSVLMHNSSNEGGAMVVKSAAEVVVGCALPFNVEMRQPRTSKSDSCGHTGSTLLDFECFPFASPVLALAGQFGSLLLIGTCFAAIFLPARYHTVASRMFTFIRGHESSFYLNMPSLL
jgi:hypothetical protein